ncbi:hypothetical protein [Paraburkholderia sp.]|uniref:hypothetical protein n=1 Tax=Paraburkholderia sp. TaxID=1926495 RepID=UPI0025E45C07|nr:hypothetical protein [Paraburkholderia sp.]
MIEIALPDVDPHRRADLFGRRSKARVRSWGGLSVCGDHRIEALLVEFKYVCKAGA